MDRNQGTLLARKKKKVKLSDEEVILFLRAYIAHPTSWSDIIADVKENIDRLSASAQQLYQTSTIKQLRDRQSAKLSALIAMDQESIQNMQIRELVQSIRQMERRLVVDPAPPDQQPRAAPVAPNRAQVQNVVQAPVPAPVQDPPVPGPAVPPAVEADRDRVAANMPSSQSEDKGAPARRQRSQRKRKRSLSALVRENQSMYRRLMKKNIAKNTERTWHFHRLIVLFFRLVIFSVNADFVCISRK